MARILMIDDDKDFGTLVSAHFSSKGHELTLTNNGREGLVKAAAVQPEVILLDISMPDMNGMEVLRELQAGDETSDIPVLVVSGKYFDQGMQEVFSQERNFRGFISKPVSLDTLLQKAEAQLKK